MPKKKSNTNIVPKKATKRAPTVKKEQQKEQFLNSYHIYSLIICLTSVIVGSGVYWVQSVECSSKAKQLVYNRTAALQEEVRQLKTQLQGGEISAENLPGKDGDVRVDISPKAETKRIELPEGAESETVFIKSAYLNQGQMYVDVDHITLLEEEDAIAAAKEDTGCPRETLGSTDCAPTLEKGYYVRNKFNDYTSLEFSNKGTVVMPNQNKTPGVISFEKFVEMFEDVTDQKVRETPFEIYTWDNVVLKVTTQF
jgi:hypothetical protein